LIPLRSCRRHIKKEEVNFRCNKKVKVKYRLTPRRVKSVGCRMDGRTYNLAINEENSKSKSNDKNK